MEDKIIEIIIASCQNQVIRENLNIDLIENDILDSLAFVTLVANLEDEFNIEIQPTQVEPDTWRSIKKIVELVKSKIV